MFLEIAGVFIFQCSRCGITAADTDVTKVADFGCGHDNIHNQESKRPESVLAVSNLAYLALHETRIQ